MIEGYKLHGVTVFTPKQLREEMNVSKPMMKFYIQQMTEGADYIKIDKEQLKAIKADTAGTPLGEIYQKMYYTPVKLVTEKGRVKLCNDLARLMPMYLHRKKPALQVLRTSKCSKARLMVVVCMSSCR